MSNTTSRTITGIILIIIGLVLTGLGFLTLLTLLYGIPILIVGVFILLNKDEDKIEERKDLNKKKSKK